MWKGLTSFGKNERGNFSGEKKYNEAFRGVYILRVCEKNLKLKLLVVLVLESKGLH